MISTNDPRFYEEYFGCNLCQGAIKYDDPTLGLRPVFDEGSAEPKFIVVGLNPGKDEIAEGRPFVGVAGKALRSIMAEAQNNWKTQTGSSNSPLTQGLLTNMARCKFNITGTSSNRTPIEAEYKNCKPIFDKMWNFLRPQIVVGCGADVIFKFGIEKRVGECCGNIYNLNYMDLNFKFIPCYHPSYYQRLNNANPENGLIVRNKMVEVFTTVIKLIES